MGALVLPKSELSMSHQLWTATLCWLGVPFNKLTANALVSAPVLADGALGARDAGAARVER